MIVFDLKCLRAHHVFEAWFGSSADYEDQRARGLVSCPICGDAEITKAVMAPRVGAKGNAAASADASSAMAVDGEAKLMLAAMAAMQKQLIARSEHVGTRFAEEARAMHLGEADKRPIHGQATRAEAQSLRAEGIDVAPLPFPVVEPRHEN